MQMNGYAYIAAVTFERFQAKKPETGTLKVATKSSWLYKKLNPHEY